MDSLKLQKKAFGGLLTSAGLVAIGVLVVVRPDMISRIVGSLLVVFGLIGLIISLFSVIGIHDALILTREGLSVMWLGSSPAQWRINWFDVTTFSVVQTQSPKVPGTALPVGRRTTKLVGISFTPLRQSQLSPAHVKRMNHFRKYFDCDEILPSAFGMSVEALVLRLNNWKSGSNPT
jgi:hypothetical protein